MLVKTKGIVFRTIKYSETSVITDIFTRERGLRSFIVSGVRKTKPKFSHALFQIMSQVEILAYDHAHKSLNRIKEIRADFHYSDLPFNIIKSSIGTFMIELCQKSIKEKEANVAMYDFLSHWFTFLDSCNEGLPNIHLLFMLEFSSQLGFQPMDNFDPELRPHFDLQEGYFVSDPNTGKYTMGRELSLLLHSIMHTEKGKLKELKLNRSLRLNLINQLIIFYQLHIENFPKLNSLEVLSEVLK